MRSSFLPAIIFQQGRMAGRASYGRGMVQRKKKVLVLGIAFSHLILVAIGASQLNLWPHESGLGRSLDYYGALSGAGSGYGFFAPGVGSQLRGSFDIVDGQGGVTPNAIEAGASHEGALRIGNLLGWFWRDTADRKLQRSLAASWAGKMFARHPEAEQVVVRLETYHLPSMKGYRSGKRPHWVPYYEAKFVHKPSTSREERSKPVGSPAAAPKS